MADDLYPGFPPLKYSVFCVVRNALTFPLVDSSLFDLYLRPRVKVRECLTTKLGGKVSQPSVLVHTPSLEK